MKLRTTLLAAAAVVGLSAPSFAAAITGQFTLTGNVRSLASGVTFDTATGLNFVGANGADNGSAAGTVLNYTGGGTGGVLDGLTCATAGACGTINDITSFASFSGATPEFTLTNGLSFDLNAPLTIQRVTSQQASNGLARIDVAGTGVYHLAGYSDTVGSFTISASGNGLVALFQASGMAVASVPEPASLALLGGGLAALGLVRRRKA